MAALASTLAKQYACKVTYLTSPGSVRPEPLGNLQVLQHSGYHHYRDIVVTRASEFTDVVLGAVVANLIPAKPIQGKFPSHNYAEGEIVSLDFLVTPRVITQVKAAAPKTNLIGFKLLSGAPPRGIALCCLAHAN